MFWRVSGLATSSPVDVILDKDSFTLEELLDEDDLIQECKSLNQRLVTFLRQKDQVTQLVRYVVEEEENSDDKRAFKYPFVACEVFTCEIDNVFNTFFENDEIMDLLFSFIEPNLPHSNLLAGYFSKVVICLMIRRTREMMSYLEAHQHILKKLVDLIGITSIMEVVMKLVGADEQILIYSSNSLQWLSSTNLLEMLVGRLGPNHGNVSEALSGIARTAPSSLASQLTSPQYVSLLFAHALESTEDNKSGVICSLSVCITLLDPNRMASIQASGVARGINHIPQVANPDTVDGMVQRLHELLALLDLSGDSSTLATTYGELTPRLGIHRLKIVEFIAVLLRTNSEGARRELMERGAIKTVLDLFFRFPFNNMLHHQVEQVVVTCLDSCIPSIYDHLFKTCDLLPRLLSADGSPDAPDTRPEPRAAAQRGPSRCGYMGHVTRLANKIAHVGANVAQVDMYLQENPEWKEWQAGVLQTRNSVENVYQWACGRPTSLDDRHDSDEEYDRDPRDFDMGPNKFEDLNSGLQQLHQPANHRYGLDDGEEKDMEFESDLHVQSFAGMSLTEEKGRPVSLPSFFSTEDAEEFENMPAMHKQGPMGIEDFVIETEGSGYGEYSPPSQPAANETPWFAFHDTPAPPPLTISKAVVSGTHDISFDDEDEDDDTLVSKDTDSSSHPSSDFNNHGGGFVTRGTIFRAIPDGANFSFSPPPTPEPAETGGLPDLFEGNTAKAFGTSRLPTSSQPSPGDGGQEEEEEEDFDVRGTSNTPSTITPHPESSPSRTEGMEGVATPGSPPASAPMEGNPMPEMGSPLPAALAAEGVEAEGEEAGFRSPTPSVLDSRRSHNSGMDASDLTVDFASSDGDVSMIRPGTPLPGSQHGMGQEESGHHAEKWEVEAGEHNGGASSPSKVGDGGSAVSHLESHFEGSGGVRGGRKERVVVATDHVIALDPRRTALAMEKAIKEGIVGEAVVLKATTKVGSGEEESRDVVLSSFNDVNYWKSSYDETIEIDNKEDAKFESKVEVQ